MCLVEGQVQPTGTMENQSVEDSSSMKFIFTWTIENFSRLNTNKHYSNIFIVGGCKWRILIFPKGNNVDYLSMYLDVADSATLPCGWSRYAQFSLTVVNHVDGECSLGKDARHRFSDKESDWGFTSFMALSELCDPSRGYLVNDTVVVEAEIVVGKVVFGSSITETTQSNKFGDDASRNKPKSVASQGGEPEQQPSHAVDKSDVGIQDDEVQDPVVESITAAICDEQGPEKPTMEASADDSLAVGQQMINGGPSQDKVGVGEVQSAASCHVPDVSEGGQSSSEATEIHFHEMANALLEKLEDEKAPNSVRMDDFNDVVSSNFIEVGIFRVPSSLEYYAKELLASRVDISTGLSSVQYVNEMVFTVLCCALKSMDATPFNEITEALILKWRDAIRGALQFGFKVDFLKDHLKSITHVYLGKLVGNFRESKELEAVDQKILETEKQLAELRALRAEKASKMCIELREICETAAANFQGNTPGTGLR